jgi:hypothetical protein
LIVLLIGGGLGLAQEKVEPPPRFGVPAESELYPQTSPKTTMISIGKAFERNRIDYLLAHLIDPAFVDEKVAQFYRIKFGKSPDQDRDNRNFDRRIKEAFDDFIKEVNKHMADEPRQTGYLTKLLKEGMIEEGGTSAKVTHKDIPNFAIAMRQIEGRWYMLNDDSPEKPKK